MKPKYFNGYGRLEWLEPEDYFSQEDWTYEGEDFEYSIVFSYTRQEYRYTRLEYCYTRQEYHYTII